jgi:Nif-specific regulatory protein
MTNFADPASLPATEAGEARKLGTLVDVSQALESAEATGTVVSTSLDGAVEALERSLIQDALKTARGNQSKAARLLGTTQRVISYKVRKYGIDPARLK